MDSVVTTILTDESSRSPEAVKDLVTKSVNNTMQPWLNVAEEQ